MNQSDAAFAYQEPSIATILNQAGLLLALNIVNFCLDKLLYCGLIGQLFIGIVWGTPGAKWIGSDMEKVIQQLGYLGLIMLVYEGGLSMSIKALRANIFVSLAVALTGIMAPIALSFILKKLVAATSLQAFAAGAALSATSLGTTFTILSTTQLVATRLGTVTTCAAMLDDVVGLVMVQVISNLGGNSNNSVSISSVTIIRPVFVSIGFALGVFLLCLFCVKPIVRITIASRRKIPRFTQTMQFVFLAHTAILLGMVAGATYAGTSSLFAAYLSGVIVSWFDELATESVTTITESHSSTSQQQSPNHQELNVHSENQQSNEEEPSAMQEDDTSRYERPTGTVIYETYYKGPVNRILLPLFFASIGFAIPITEMFKGNIIWRGIVYALLMAFGKMITGVWLVRFSPSYLGIFKKTFSYATSVFSGLKKGGDKQQPEKKRSRRRNTRQPNENPTPSGNDTISGQQTDNGNDNGKCSSSNIITNQAASSRTPAQTTSSTSVGSVNTRISLPPKPKSLYPPFILGLAMIARGEVGYLIASLAQSQGIFDDNSSGGSSSSDIYLVIIWAISICTLIGPIAVGTLVRRVKRLQKTRGDASTADPLGVWGI